MATVECRRHIPFSEFSRRGYPTCTAAAHRGPDFLLRRIPPRFSFTRFLVFPLVAQNNLCPVHPTRLSYTTTIAGYGTQNVSAEPAAKRRFWTDFGGETWEIKNKTVESRVLRKVILYYTVRSRSTRCSSVIDRVRLSEKEYVQYRENSLERKKNRKYFPQSYEKNITKRLWGVANRTRERGAKLFSERSPNTNVRVEHRLIVQRNFVNLRGFSHLISFFSSYIAWLI